METRERRSRLSGRSLDGLTADLPMFRARIAFSIAAAAEILIVGLMTVSWPTKASDGAIPAAIIVCGLVGPYLPGPWYRVGLLGAALGLLDAGVFIILSSTLGAPETFTVAARIAISIGFGSNGVGDVGVDPVRKLARASVRTSKASTSRARRESER
jgi:hypothetical protein